MRGKRKLHDWRYTATFKLTEKEAQAAHRVGGNKAEIGDWNLDGAYVWCWRCEATFSDVHDKPCPGRPVVSTPAPEPN